MFLILALLILWGWGILITLLTVPEISALERLSLGWVLGLGLSTVLIFIALFSNIAVEPLKILFFLLILIWFLSFFLRKKLFLFRLQLKRSFLGFKRFNTLEKFLLFGIIFLCFYVLVVSFYWPVHAWDAITLYDFRGKILADPVSAFSYLRGEFNWFYYGYPLLTSLSHSFVYLFGGSNPLFLSGFFYIAFGLMFYGALREFSSRKLSLLGTFLLLAHFQMIRHIILAYSNLPYLVYFSMGTIYLLIWMVKKKEGYFLIGGLLVGLAVWTRDQEPFWFVNLLIVTGYALFQKKFVYPFILAFLVAMPRFFWGAFKDKVAGPIFGTSDQFQNSFNQLIQMPNFERIKEVSVFLYGVMVGAWGPPILLLFLVILFLSRKDLRQIKNFSLEKTKNFYLLLFIFLNFVALFLGTYILSFNLSAWKDISDSVARISTIFYPLLLYFIFTSAVVKNDKDK